MNWFRNSKYRVRSIARNILLAAAANVALSGCVTDMVLEDLSISAPQVSNKMLAEMPKKGMLMGVVIVALLGGLGHFGNSGTPQTKTFVSMARPWTYG